MMARVGADRGSLALGDDCQSGGEPLWDLSNDDEFIADEEERRGLPPGSLQPFSRQPYQSDVTITEYTTWGEEEEWPQPWLEPRDAVDGGPGSDCRIERRSRRGTSSSSSDSDAWSRAAGLRLR